MQIMWEEQREKLVYQFGVKNAKKKTNEFREVIGQLSDIKPRYRDLFLMRYIARCKLVNALAFF